MGHDLRDETARNELENAKREAIKALGVVSKVKEKLEAIELVLTIEILLFLNLESSYGDARHFRSTRDQCLYFLRTIKSMPQVSQFFDVELRGAFSKGTFHSDRMWLLTEILRMDVDVLAFACCYAKQRDAWRNEKVSLEDGVGAIIEANLDEIHASFQCSIEVLYGKTHDETIMHLLMRQLHDFVDLYCLTRDANHWIASKSLATVLSLDIKTAAGKRIDTLVRRVVNEYETRMTETALVETIAKVRDTTGIVLSNELNVTLGRLLEENLRIFLRGDDCDEDDFKWNHLRAAELIADRLELTLSSASEVCPSLLSFWTNMFLRYDADGDARLLRSVPSLITIYGSTDILDGRRDVGVNDPTNDAGISASSFQSNYEPRNAFSTQKTAKWISGEVTGHPFHEWISRSIAGSHAKVILVGIKSTPHVQAAPTKLSVQGRNNGENEWKMVREVESLSWKKPGWKIFVVDTPEIFAEYRLNFYDNGASNVVSVAKIKLYA